MSVTHAFYTRFVFLFFNQRSRYCLIKFRPGRGGREGERERQPIQINTSLAYPTLIKDCSNKKDFRKIRINFKIIDIGNFSRK